MKKITQGLLLSATSLGLLAAVVSPGLVSAQEQGQNILHPRQYLIQSLVKRFSLDEAAVKQVFDEHEAQMHQNTLTMLEQRLTKAVEQNRLTEAQKQALLAKVQEIHAKHAEWRTLPPNERVEKMRQYQNELESWATQQGIDKSFVRSLFPGLHHGRMMKKAKMTGKGQGKMFEHRAWMK